MRSLYLQQSFSAFCISTDVGVFRAHAAQFNRAQRPQIVHLIHQLRAGSLCQAVCGINVERVGGGGDDGVRICPAQFSSFFAYRVKAAQRNVSMLRMRPRPLPSYSELPCNPEIPDAVDLSPPSSSAPAHFRVFRCADARKMLAAMVTGMARLHPALRHEIRPVFHAVACTSCIVIDQKNVHRLASVSHAPQSMCSDLFRKRGRRRRACCCGPRWSGVRMQRLLQECPPWSRSASTFQLPCSVSTHSVSERSVMQGTSMNQASFCRPPESVSTWQALAGEQQASQDIPPDQSGWIF